MTARISPQSKSPIPHSKPGLTLDIIYRRITELKPDPANPRRHTKKQIRGRLLRALAPATRN